MKNPFVHGVPVEGEDFFGREEELKAVGKMLTEKGNLVVHAPFGRGKTSLLHHLQKKMHASDKSVNIYLSLLGITTREKLTEQLASVCARSLVTKISEVMKTVETYIPPVKAEVVFEGREATQFSLDFHHAKRNLEATIKGLLELPARIAAEKHRKVVVVLDDYQEADQLEVDWIAPYVLEKPPAPNVHYVFSLSDRNIAQQWFFHNGSARDHIADFYLPQIDEAKFSRHIRNRFNRFNIEIKEEFVQRILRLCRNEPFYVQLLCYHIFEFALDRHGGLVTKEILELAVDKAIMHQSFAYRIIWDSLSGTQRKVISGLARSIGLQVYSAEFMSRHEIASPSSSQTALKYLVSRNFVRREESRYSITNPLMEEWLRRKTY